MNYFESILRMMEIVVRKFVHYDKSGMKFQQNLTEFSFMDLIVLIELKQHGQSTTQELIGFFEVDRGIVTTVINRLCSLGLVEKKKDDKDRRKTYIFLTEAGEQLYEEISEAEKLGLSFILKDMTINEQKAILKFLSRVNQLTVDKYDMEPQ